MLWCELVQLTKYGLVCFEARTYVNRDRQETHCCMSEDFARVWLAKQGFPFHQQPRLITVKGA